MATRIGPRMREVLRLADKPGGISIRIAAYAVSPFYSPCYGYPTVNRCIRAGLVAVGRPVESTSRRGLFISTLAEGVADGR
jgi:hypothetical protein